MEKQIILTQPNKNKNKKIEKEDSLSLSDLDSDPLPDNIMNFDPDSFLESLYSISEEIDSNSMMDQKTKSKFFDIQRIKKNKNSANNRTKRIEDGLENLMTLNGFQFNILNTLSETKTKGSDTKTQNNNAGLFQGLIQNQLISTILINENQLFKTDKEFQNYSKKRIKNMLDIILRSKNEREIFKIQQNLHLAMDSLPSGIRRTTHMKLSDFLEYFELLGIKIKSNKPSIISATKMSQQEIGYEEYDYENDFTEKCEIPSKKLIKEYRLVMFKIKTLYHVLLLFVKEHMFKSLDDYSKIIHFCCQSLIVFSQFGNLITNIIHESFNHFQRNWMNKLPIIIRSLIRTFNIYDLLTLITNFPTKDPNVSLIHKWISYAGLLKSKDKYQTFVDCLKIKEFKYSTIIRILKDIEKNLEVHIVEESCLFFKFLRYFIHYSNVHVDKQLKRKKIEKILKSLTERLRETNFLVIHLKTSILTIISDLKCFKSFNNVKQETTEEVLENRRTIKIKKKKKSKKNKKSVKRHKKKKEKKKKKISNKKNQNTNINKDKELKNTNKEENNTNKESKNINKEPRKNNKISENITKTNTKPIQILNKNETQKIRKKNQPLNQIQKKRKQKQKQTTLFQFFTPQKQKKKYSNQNPKKTLTPVLKNKKEQPGNVKKNYSQTILPILDFSKKEVIFEKQDQKRKRNN
ncbi:zinc finger fyve domain-containing protein [Anaeramoeba flamelloides]|uniref:Zinc finger fyve domain-containing protein n=1 Tax=Anaeramoeba flamelloides TaxID=1746091 RepID=A0AAV8A547_9EUKA|nr:zinc finger fyve domain-containing protein [Anaeramoeba flamelloides]